jgi:hypothetical protein
VWHSVAIPRHSFVLWLVFKGALVTREKMCRCGYMGDCLCLFGWGCIENSEHHVLPMRVHQTHLEEVDGSLSRGEACRDMGRY